MSVFVEEEIDSLNIAIIYTDQSKIVNTSNYNYKLNNKGILSKEELLYIIKNKLIVDDVKFRLISISLFHLSLKADEVKDYMNSDVGTTPADNLIHYKNITDIPIIPTVNIFSDLSTLYILLNKHTMTTNNTTKRIYMNTTSHKTRKKQHM
jgi:hypothetical protein